MRRNGGLSILDEDGEGLVLDADEAAAPHPRARELVELAEDAPTLHLYVQDLDTSCDHVIWRDPGFTEWSDVVEDFADARRGMP